MNSLFTTPLEKPVADWWSNIDAAYKKAFFLCLLINVIAFGFEMTNVSFHHDDVSQFFIQDTILGHYLGRFTLGWLHYYAQNAYIMPFLQMAEGMLFMSLYGVLVAGFWGARRVLDILLVAAIVCVFPYMAQVYQYNTSMATYTLAHLLAASAVILSTRGTYIHAAIAILLYFVAFSIYQSVIANAAAIFVIWMLVKLLFPEDGSGLDGKSLLKRAMTAFASVAFGGALYMIAVSIMGIGFETEQAAGDAFRLGQGIDLKFALSEIIQGTRSFFLWPENYYPEYLKRIHLILFASAGIFCVLIPKNPAGKIGACVLLVLAVFSPRVLQLVHPAGNYHNLTLTAYALVIAGSVLIVCRAGYVLARNAAVVAALLLLAGYIMQCNWISTVNYLNTMAHFSAMSQVLSRVRALHADGWDGRQIVVVGTYDMPSEYPFKRATGVAVKFMDAVHMQHLARLMREDVSIVEADEEFPAALEYAANHPSWPHPDSVGVVDGAGVVVLSKD